MRAADESWTPKMNIVVIALSYNFYKATAQSSEMSHYEWICDITEQSI